MIWYNSTEKAIPDDSQKLTFSGSFEGLEDFIVFPKQGVLLDLQGCTDISRSAIKIIDDLSSERTVQLKLRLENVYWKLRRAFGERLVPTNQFGLFEVCSNGS